jgi:hypothetical protein
VLAVAVEDVALGQCWEPVELQPGRLQVRRLAGLRVAQDVVDRVARLDVALSEGARDAEPAQQFAVADCECEWIPGFRWRCSSEPVAYLAQ